jgi:hypothetical protein
MTSLPCGRDFIDDRLISPGSGIAGSIRPRAHPEWMSPYHDRMPVLLRAEDFTARSILVRRAPEAIARARHQHAGFNIHSELAQLP